MNADSDLFYSLYFHTLKLNNYKPCGAYVQYCKPLSKAHNAFKMIVLLVVGSFIISLFFVSCVLDVTNFILLQK